MAGYDPSAANEYNQLIQQGLDPADAAQLAGIAPEDLGNYSVVNGLLTENEGPPTQDTDVGPQTDYGTTYDEFGTVVPIAPPTQDTPVNPASDPSQFPAYDDEGNLQPGFAINEETGQTFFRGVSPPIRQTAGFDPNFDEFGNLDAAIAAQQAPGFDPNFDEFGNLDAAIAAQQAPGFDPNFDEFAGLDAAIAAQQNATPINNPYYGLTSEQIQQLGGADPTDPYIRARLGIPQLSGSPIAATPGFGTIKTGIPLIDSALSFLGGLFSSGPPTTSTTAPAAAGFAAALGNTPAPVPAVTPPTQDTPVNPASDPSQFPAYDDDGNLQPGFAINDETGDTYYRGFPSNDVTNQPVNPASDPSQFPAYDDDGNLQPGFAINEETGQTYYQGFDRTFDNPVNPASDPSQFPAYDDDGNLQPGFAINEETGDTYYQGFERNTDQPVNPEEDPFEQSRYEAELAYNAQEPDEFSALSVDDPYYGLTPQQLQDLGGADPTDPYIRARLGIPQLPGSTLAATPGFGTINTGIPLIDNALNFLGGLFGSPATPPTPAAPPVTPTADPSQFPAYDDDGNLMPGYAINEETGEPYYQGFEKTTDQPVNPASDPSQFPAYDDEGNLQPGFAINEETGEPYYQGVGPATGADVTTLSDEETAALFEGTDTPTAAEQAATNAQTAEDAAALYPGTNNTNLKNINEAQAAIDQNEAGIANAQDIIARNNAELADPNISDERRAELEANNAAQENYIRLAEDNTAENELVIEANADAFAAGGGEPDSGLGPDPVPLTEEETAALFAEAEASTVEVAEADVVPLTEEETAALFAEAEASTVEVAEADVVPLSEEETAALFAEAEASTVETVDAEAVPLSEEETAALFAEAEASTVEAEDPFALDPNEDEALQLPPGAEDENVESEEAFALNPDEDEALQTPPGAEDDDPPTEEPFALNPDEDEALQTPPGAEDDDPPTEEPFALNPDEDEAIANQQGGDDEGADPLGDAETVEANNLAAMKIRAQSQATLQSRFKTPGDQDWRVRIQLSPNSDYLYNDSDPGILAPLRATNGVLFPYVPQITTAYQANYEQYDLTHSNYRGIFYKNSRVNDIQIRGTFTAQDTKEAEYLLAVIHFFRSVTKMFYGQDWQRGTPPPMVFLSGFGNFQFNGHPCVVNTFNYTLPNDVDYIRATNFNNYGTNLFNRRTAPQSSPGGINAAGAVRLANALLPKGALPKIPAAGPVNGTVTNTQSSTYVPTKLEIDLTLIPVQTRSQVSKQFSMQEFANGNLIRGGFW